MAAVRSNLSVRALILFGLARDFPLALDPLSGFLLQPGAVPEDLRLTQGHEPTEHVAENFEVSPGELFIAVAVMVDPTGQRSA